MKRDSRVCCRRWACSRQLKLRRRGCSLPPRRFPKHPPRLQRPAGLRNCCKPCPAEPPNLAVHRLNIRERVKRRLPIGRPNPLRLLPRANREPSRSCSALLKAPGRRRPSRCDREQALPPPVPPAPLRRCCRWTSNPLLLAPPFPAAPYYEERKPAAGSLDYGATPQAARPAEPSRDPFSPAPSPESPIQSGPPSGGVGITRLIRMLDEPGTQPPPVEAAPAPRSAEPGIWTQTFATLNTPQQPPAPKAPEWTPPPPPVPQPVVPPLTTAATSTAGPSEFTRILDASRMRELAMKGGQPPSAPLPPQAPPPQSFTPPPVPSYSAPPPPPVGGMPGYGGFRRPRRRCPRLIQ